MINNVKMTTISVRVEEDLVKQIDKITDIMSMNKSDFVRGCLEKLCKDNRLLLDHYDKIPEYIAFIKDELKKLPGNMIRIANGTCDNIKDSALLMLCDELWQTSEVVFTNWKMITEKYELTREKEGNKEITDFSDAKESQGLLGLQDLLFASAEKSGQVEKVDMPVFLRDPNWISQVEADMISLFYAVKTSFEDKQARVIIKKLLENLEEQEEEESLRLVIDARGSFRRSGHVLHLPVYTEKAKSTE